MRITQIINKSIITWIAEVSNKSTGNLVKQVRDHILFE